MPRWRLFVGLVLGAACSGSASGPTIDAAIADGPGAGGNADGGVGAFDGAPPDAATPDIEPRDAATFEVDRSQLATYLPTEIPRSAPLAQVMNVDVGGNTWRGQNVVPNDGNRAVPHKLRYQRILWSDIETAQGVYDYSPFEAELTVARTTHGLVWFGIYNMRGADANAGTFVPPYLAMAPYGQMVNGTWLPDFNNAFFQQRLAALVQAVAARYANEPRLYGFDMRAWGPYNENNTYRGATTNLPVYSVSDASKTFFIDAYRAAFPSRQLFVMIDDAFTVHYCLGLTPGEQTIPVGLAGNSMANATFDKRFAQYATAYPNDTRMQDRWKLAPVGGETFNSSGVTPALLLSQILDRHIALVGNGNSGSFASWSAAEQTDLIAAYKLAGYRFVIAQVQAPTTLRRSEGLALSASWHNRNATPAYRRWRVEWRLYDAGGAMAWSAPSTVDLHVIVPTGATPVVIDDVFPVPAIAAGAYTLQLAVVDPTGTIDPMVLAIQGRRADGAYNLGPNGTAVVVNVTN